ncbi:hypothetical protein [Rosenbergiella metrosideri]|uniref:hypothetical protein n=2 Tax=Rosenbergiella TaxID=1356488 RepID=UPI001F4FCCC1|nr:hypothetical protein [Rosenbergiella metrosideri]
MLTTNHKWLLGTPFICASYPDVALKIIGELSQAGLAGLDRWGITAKCEGISPHKIRISINQLESYGVIDCDTRNYTLALSDYRSCIIDKFNSTQARLLSFITRHRNGKAATAGEIHAHYLLERSQLQPAARRLEANGYITITLSNDPGTRSKLIYQLKDLTAKTVGALLDLQYP